MSEHKRFSIDIPSLSMFRRISGSFGLKNQPELPKAAVPGVGECPVCLEVVPSLKMLACDHSVCIACINRVLSVSPVPLVTCSECLTKTDVTNGVESLVTSYLGKVRCDFCNEKRNTQDTHWCTECTHVMCSKCRGKEHDKAHKTEPWSKMGALSYGLRYLKEVRDTRNESTGSSGNKVVVSSFMKEVQRHLEQQLEKQLDIEDLELDLESRYGGSNKIEEDKDIEYNTWEDGPNVITKVLQLAGANVTKKSIPKLSEDQYQIYFTVNPSEVADFIRSKIELIPFDEQHPLSATDPSQSPEAAEKLYKRVGHAPVLKMDFCPLVNAVALRMRDDVQLYDLNSGGVYAIHSGDKQVIRDICFEPNTGNLLVVFQSIAKHFVWILESHAIQESEVKDVYQLDLDVDPQDRVEALHLAVTGQNNEELFEMRQCALSGATSEIWLAVLIKKKEKPVKVKEKLIYQKERAHYKSLKVISNGDERLVFVWDEMSESLYRLCIKDNRVEGSIRIIQSSEEIHYTLDSEMRLWIYDPICEKIQVSSDSVANTDNPEVILKDICRFSSHRLNGLFIKESTVIGVALSYTQIFVLTFL